ncbi:MAG: hypothetical protein QW328_07145 [Nitrososphaerota archaeon]
MSESVNVKEHMLNLINALANLSPSRNILSQLILLLPEDLATVERSYQEAVSNEAKAILRSLGVKFGDKVERTENSFATELYKHIHRIFDWLDNEHLYMRCIDYGGVLYREVRDKMSEVRSSLAKLTGVHIDLIPNPYLEWAKLVLKKLSQTYGQSKIIGFLKALLAHDSFRDEDYRRENWQRFLDEVRTEIGANPAEFEEILRFTVMREEELLYSKGSRRHPEGDIYLEHSKYHLDPILCETYRYVRGYKSGERYEYVVRHKEALIKALEETFAWESK